MSSVPAELHYTSSHEWIRIEGDVATVGITDYAQAELGDVVYVDLPTVGRILQSGDAFGSVESVKTVSDLYAPLPGEVIDVNPVLGAQSELVNTDPYGKGYLIKMRLAEGASGEPLMDAATYEKSLV